MRMKEMVRNLRMKQSRSIRLVHYPRIPLDKCLIVVS